MVPPEFPKGQVQVTLTPVAEEDLPYTRGVKAGIPYTRGKLPPTSLADWPEYKEDDKGV